MVKNQTLCHSFFDWYNQDHQHAGIGPMTPDQVHYGQADEVYAARQKTLDARPSKLTQNASSESRQNAGSTPPTQRLRNPSLNSNAGCLNR